MAGMWRYWGLAGVLAAITTAWWLRPSVAQETIEAPAVVDAPAPPPSSTLSFVGDILLAEGVGRVAAERGGAGYLFAGVRSLLTADDLTIGNLECPVATTGTAVEKQYAFRANPRVLPGLKKGGIDAVSLANNHTLDYGRPALLETLERLQQAGLPAAGAGRTVAEAHAPVMLPLAHHTVALVAASRVLPSTSWYATKRQAGLAGAYDPARLLASIRAARGQADIVAVYLHWGVERATTPEAYQRTLAKQCIEAGADLVVGAHPHVLQGFEYHRGKLIAYSLGNFVFTNSAKATAVLQVTVTGDTTTARVIPCAITAYRPAPLTDPTKKSAQLRDLQARSFEVTIDADGTLTPAR